MEKLVELRGDSLNYCSHTYGFCSEIQFAKWANVINRSTETVPLQDAKVKNNQVYRTLIRFESKSLVFVQGKCSYCQHSSKRSVQNIDMTKHAYHFLRQNLEA